MKNKILWKTNFLICFILVVGFSLTFILSYRANSSAAQQNVEHVSALTSEGIYYQMNNILSKPVNVSMTMANDSLLKDILRKEAAHPEDVQYMEKLGEYLNGYREAYDYDSVFLVSASTLRYYNFNGLDRVLVPGDAENVWYFDGMLKSDEDCSINVDNDEVEGAGNAITLFVNCKIHDDAGELLGVVGVGVQIGYLQGILEEYYREFDVSANFIDDSGMITLSAEHNGYEKLNYFEQDEYAAKNRNKVMEWSEDTEAFEFWGTDDAGRKRDYIVVRYLPDISWHLVVESNTDKLMLEIRYQFIGTILIIVILIIIILLVTTRVIGSFNRKIIELTKAHEQERKTIFEKATEQLFENIYELDITHNRPANKETEDYFMGLGAPAGASFDESLKIIAEKQIKPEFRKNYLNTFSANNVLDSFKRGVDSLKYEFMITGNGEDYYWIRITARLIVSEADGSLHMLTYRQNIDEEKKREYKMQEMARTDEMTGLLNKVSTQRAIDVVLAGNRDRSYAFFILDIDHFKDANDFFGHAFGDSVIKEFASVLRSNFRQGDLVGRIGGDEFAAFMEIRGKEIAAAKARRLNESLNKDYEDQGGKWHISASIGVAFVPEDGADFEELYHHADAALYETKRRGRGSFTLYEKSMSGNNQMYD